VEGLADKAVAGRADRVEEDKHQLANMPVSQFAHG